MRSPVNGLQYTTGTVHRAVTVRRPGGTGTVLVAACGRTASARLWLVETTKDVTCARCAAATRR